MFLRSEHSRLKHMSLMDTSQRSMACFLNKGLTWSELNWKMIYVSDDGCRHYFQIRLVFSLFFSRLFRKINRITIDK